MSFTNLPPDILEVVCQQTDVLSTADFAALARSCSDLNEVAKRHLHRQLLVSSSRHNLHLIPRLANSPRLARHVRSLTVSVARPSRHLLQAFYQQLAIALLNMTELLCLTLDVDASATWVLPCIYGRHARMIQFATSFPLDSFVAQFLHSTPRLQNVKLGTGTEQQHAGSLPPLHPLLPLLSTFAGSISDARLIIPGRPVADIHLYGTITSADIPFLAQSTARVHTLSLSTTSSPLSLLSELATLLPTIVMLQIHAVSALAGDHLEHKSFMAQVNSTLDAFEHLEMFELVGWGHSNCSIKRRGAIEYSDESTASTPLRDTEVNESSGLAGPASEYVDFFADW